VDLLEYTDYKYFTPAYYFLDTSYRNMYMWKYYEVFFPVLFSVARMCSVTDRSMNPGGARLLILICFVEDHF